MFTESALLKAKNDLYNIVANHSMQDYLQANYKNGKRKSKKHIPYSTSIDTKNALEMYKIVCKKIEDITADEEEKVKAFLLIYRTTKREYLKAN